MILGKHKSEYLIPLKKTIKIIHNSA